MKQILKLLFLWSILFFAATPRAHAVLKTAPNFSSETENVSAKFEKKSVHKPSRIERWLARKAEKQLTRLKNNGFEKYLPDDDDKNAKKDKKKFSKIGFSLFILGLGVGFVVLAQGVLKSSSSLNISFIMMGAGFIFALYSIFKEGFNFRNGFVILIGLLLYFA
jgi:hypothetical protein